MPKILPPTAGANPSVALAPPSRIAPGKSDRASAFDDVLSGARKRKEPAPADRDEAQPAPTSSKSAKPKQRAAKRDDARNQPETTDAAPRTEATRESASPGSVGEASDEAVQTTPDDSHADDVAEVDDATETDSAAEGFAAHTTVQVPQDAAQIPIDLAITQPGSANETPAGTPAEVDAELSTDPTAAAERSPASSTGAVAFQDDLVSGVLNVGAVTTAQTPAGSMTDLPTDAVAAAASTKPAASVMTGVGRPVATPSATESMPEGRSQARESDGDNAQSPVALNAAETVEALDPPDSNTPGPAPHSAATAAPVADAAATSRGIENLAPQQGRTAEAPAATSTALPAPTPEARFADDNHPTIVAGVRGQLMPTGGTMRIQLDPPELGPLAVTVRLNNGVMEASFEASSDEAAKLLSHSLGSLKTSLESQGVHVERLHVQQAPKSEQGNQQGSNDRDQQQQNRDPQQEHAARQDHQRREMLRRMWRKLTGAEDPLDTLA